MLGKGSQSLFVVADLQITLCGSVNGHLYYKENLLRALVTVVASEKVIN